MSWCLSSNTVTWWVAVVYLGAARVQRKYKKLGGNDELTWAQLLRSGLEDMLRPMNP
jgi:hypothetical protein